MTLSHDLIQKILQEKGLELNQTDIEKIRILYLDLSLEEQSFINDIEEIISQIQITPRNNEVIEN
jgi:RecA-family ATPase